MTKLKITAMCTLLAAMNTSVQAQSNVTLYGILDGGVQYLSRSFSFTSGNTGKVVGLVGSGWAPSEFGMKGNEDLGGGLKAEFNLESGIDIASGQFLSSNGNFFGRQAWVGLKGGFGEVKAGLQFSPLFVSLYESDPRSFSSFGSMLPIYANTAEATGAFNQNAISYQSPTIGGLTGTVMYAFGGVAGDFQSGRQYSASLKYDNGSLMLNAAFYDSNPGGVVTTFPPSNLGFEGRMVGAAYRFDSLTVKGSFVNYKISGGLNNNVYDAGVDYFPIPFIDIQAAVYYIKDKNDSNNHSLMTSIGVQYLISRATAIYAQIGLVNNHGAETTGLATVPIPFSAMGATTAGGNIGIRHVF